MYFSASDAATGAELWVTDGTNGGTRMVSDIVPGAAGSDPIIFAALGDQIVFHATVPGTGRELWVSNGTAQTTRLLKDILVGYRGQPLTVQRPANGGTGRYRVVGDHFYFQAEDDAHGVELWVTDGTTAGTHLVFDLNPGPDNSSPSGLALVNGHLLFTGFAPSIGRELWALPVGAHAQRIGHGCAPGALPELRGSTPTLGTTLELDVRHRSRPGQQAVLLLGAQALAPSAWLGHCAIYVDLTLPTWGVPLMLDARGEARFNAVLPNNPALHGASACAQAAIDAQGAPADVELTPGLRLEFRR